MTLLFYIQKFYDYFMLKTDKKLFCHIMNIKFIIRRLDCRFDYDRVLNKYICLYGMDKKERIYFYHRTQGNASYKNGVLTRSASIGNAYHLSLISFKDGDLVVDCGANVGDLSLYFKHKKILINLIAIEPSPLEYECLQKNVLNTKNYNRSSGQDISTMNVGLFDTEKTLDFYVSSEGADSSLISPKEFTNIVKVNVHRLDELLPNRKIKLLKLEAEGAEPEVLLGCENILDNIEYISADLGFERGIDESSTLVPVVNYLLSHGFALVEVSKGRRVALFKNKSLS
jgi:FkbM family methyltransferase